MFTKLHKSIGLSVVAGLTPFMLAVAPVAAQAAPVTMPAQVQTQPGSNVNTAGAPSSGWVEIPAKGTQWYKFSYHYDNSTARDSEGHTTQNTPSQATVKLTMDTPGTVGFAVWTPGSLQNPVHDPNDTKNGKSDHTNDKTQPVGVGTVVNLGTIHSYLDYANNTSVQDQDQQMLREDVAQPLVTDKKGNVLNPQVLTWVGGATASDTYYVAVKNSSNAPVHYMLSISGPTVSFNK
ncbi:MAG: hypothetical protein NT075_00500 [Chloroflexi bacterium]|nr:hypothetical protein [Chloroflexota bacterium]